MAQPEEGKTGDPAGANAPGSTAAAPEEAPAQAAERPWEYDRPIETPDEDVQGLHSVACTFAQELLTRSQQGNVSASIQGAWGAGKSCLLNLIRRELEKPNLENVRAYSFDVWLIGSLESLLVQNLQALVDVLAGQSPQQERAKRLQERFHRAVAEHGGKVGGWIGVGLGLLSANPWAAAAAVGSMKAATNFAKEKVKESAQRATDPAHLRSELTALLEQSPLRFYLFLDEVDRLTTEEMLNLFRLVRLLSALPKVNVIAAFDPAVVERTLNPYGGLSFADKIFFWPYYLPPSKPLPHLARLLERCDIDFGEFSSRGSNLTLASLLSPLLCNGRSAKRLCHAAMFALAQLGRQVHFADLLAVEAVRMLDAPLLEQVWSNSLVGSKSADNLLKEVVGGKHDPLAIQVLGWLLTRKVEDPTSHTLYFDLGNAEVFIRLDPGAISAQLVSVNRLLAALGNGLGPSLELFQQAESNPQELVNLLEAANSLVETSLDPKLAQTLLEVVVQRGDILLKGLMAAQSRSGWLGAQGAFRRLLSPVLRLAGPPWKARDLGQICGYGQFQTLLCLAHDAQQLATREDQRKLAEAFKKRLGSSLSGALRKKTLRLATPLLAGVLVHAAKAGLDARVKTWMRHHMKTPRGFGEICLGFQVRSAHSRLGQRTGYQRHLMAELSGLKPRTLQARARKALAQLEDAEVAPYREAFQSILSWDGRNDTDNFGLDD